MLVKASLAMAGLRLVYTVKKQNTVKQNTNFCDSLHMSEAERPARWFLRWTFVLLVKRFSTFRDQWSVGHLSNSGYFENWLVRIHRYLAALDLHRLSEFL